MNEIIEDLTKDLQEKNLTIKELEQKIEELEKENKSFKDDLEEVYDIIKYYKY